MPKRRFWAAASLGIGLLQAWDSGAFGSGPAISLLTVTGILVPTATILARTPDLARVGALLTGSVLLLVARIIAPISLNALHLALFPAALYILILRGLLSDGHHQAA